MLLISYFRVAQSFCFKARVSDKPLMSKLMIFLLFCKKLIISQAMFHTWLPFKTEIF